MIALNPPACISGRLASTTDPAILEQRRQWTRDRMTDNHAIPVDRSMSNPFENPGVYIWRGKTYLGIRAVARAAGVHHNTVHGHLERHGHLDRLGIGRQCNWPKIGRIKAKPFSLLGREWPSHRAMARDLGLTQSRLSRWIAEGRLDRIAIAMMHADARRMAA